MAVGIVCVGGFVEADGEVAALRAEHVAAVHVQDQLLRRGSRRPGRFKGKIYRYLMPSCSWATFYIKLKDP